MEKLYIAFLSKTLNIDESQVSDLVKAEDGEIKKDALKILLELDKDRVSKISGASEDELKQRFENGYAKAKGEVLGDFEKTVRDEFKITSNKKGVDLINELVNSKISSLEKDGIDPESVVKSKVYLDMVKQKDDEKQSEIDAVKTDYEGKINSYKQVETNKLLSEKANEIIVGLNPIFSENQSIADNQRKSIIRNILSSQKFEINEGRIIPYGS